MESRFLFFEKMKSAITGSLPMDRSKARKQRFSASGHPLTDFPTGRIRKIRYRIQKNIISYHATAELAVYVFNRSNPCIFLYPLYPPIYFRCTFKEQTAP